MPMTADTVLPFHPLADLFPLLEGDDFAELVADIREHGQRLPIVVHQGQILDGRNRYRACLEADVKPDIQILPDDADPAIVRSLNLTRRHLTTDQRAAIAAELVPAFAEAARQRQLAGVPVPPDQRGTAAEQAGRELAVSEASVKRALVRQRTDPKAHEAAKRGERTRARTMARTRARTPGQTAAGAGVTPPLLRGLHLFRQGLPSGWKADGSKERLAERLADMPIEASKAVLEGVVELWRPLAQLRDMAAVIAGAKAGPETVYCSFCGTSQHELKQLISGPGGVVICDACVDLCVTFITSTRAERAAKAAATETEQAETEPGAGTGQAVEQAEPAPAPELETGADDEQGTLRRQLLDRRDDGYMGRGGMARLSRAIGVGRVTAENFLKGGRVYGKNLGLIRAFLGQ
jgi:hypothetical protein